MKQVNCKGCGRPLDAVPETKRQKAVLDFAREFAAREGYVPSYAQICAGLGLSSKATVAKHVAALRRQGIEVGRVA